MIQYFPVVTGSLTVLGNINVSGSITTSGSITISGSITSASFASTASYWSGSITNASSASFASTASFVALAQSASNAVSAATASFANNLTVAGTLTAQTLVVQTITSSVDFVTGSTRFGSILGNTHVFSGSVSMNPGGLFVSSSGNVSIGTSNQNYFFEAFGNSTTNLSYFTTSGSANRMIVGAKNNGNGALVDIRAHGSTYTETLIGNSATNAVGVIGSPRFSAPMVIGTDNISPLVLGVNNLEVMRITGSNVGIGTTSPSASLDVASTARFFSAGNWMQFETNVLTSLNNDGAHIRSVISADVAPTYTWKGDTDTGMYTPGANTIAFSTAGINRLTLASTGTAIFSGSVGIGNVTPSAWASPFTVIQGGSHGQHIGFQSNGPDMKIGSNNYYNGSGYVYTVSSNGAAQFNVGGNSGFSFSTAPSGTAGNAVTFTTALYIPVGGSVYINNATTSNFINLESLLGNAGSAIISIAQTDSNKLAKATIIVQRSAYLSGVTYTVATLATQPIANYLTFGISGTYLTINTTGGAGTMAYNALVIPAY